jgi:alpha-ribazole phosphatase
MTTRPGTVIDLLRHGEVEGGLCLGAHADATPSAVGARQVDSWARAPWRWAGIVSSPLGRCRAAARTLAASLS